MMHYISTLLVLMTVMVLIHARSSSCPEEYRELRRRNDDDDSSSDSDEDLCDQAMDFVARQGDSIKNRINLRAYCAHYDEAAELARENNDTICDKKKRDLNIKRKRQDSIGNSDDDDDDDDEKRQALRKRQLDKRIALRFIRKRMS